MNTQTQTTTTPKAPAPIANKGNGQAGTNGGTKAKLKGTKGVSKAEKMVARAKGEKTARKKSEPVERDVFGFAVKSKTSLVAAMYLGGGATTAEVKKAHGSPHLNLLKQVAEQGHTVKKTKTDVDGRKVNKYSITLKAGTKKPAKKAPAKKAA